MDDAYKLITQQGVRAKRLKELNAQLKELIHNNINCYEVFKQQVDTWGVYHKTHNILVNSAKMDSNLEQQAYFVNDEYNETRHTTTQIMSDIMDYQAACSLKLNQMLTNFKKTSVARKTNEYATKKLRALEELWDIIISNDKALQVNSDKTDEYYKGNKFTQMQLMYNQLKIDLKMISNNGDEEDKDHGEDHDEEQGEDDEEEQADEIQNIEQQRRIRIQEVKLDKFLDNLRKIKSSLNRQTKPTALRVQTEINQKWNELENADDEIKASFEDGDTIKNYLDRYNRTKIKWESISENLTQHLDTMEEKRSDQSKIKIKPLEITNFDGDCRKWHTFFETFTDIVEKGRCSDIEKMHYLNNSLEGDAKKVISHLVIAQGSYSDAVKLLKNRFDNQRKTTAAFIDAILEIPQLQQRSASALIGMHDIVLEALLNLERLGHEVPSWDPILVTILLKKLDYESLKIFEEGLESPKIMPTVQQLLDFLVKRHQMLESLKGSKGKSNAPTTNKNKQSYFSGTRECKYCQKDHSIYDCDSFKREPLGSRKSFIFKNKLCKKCLAHDYKKTCTSKYNCRICNGKSHNTLIHDDNMMKESVKKTKEIAETTKTTNVSKSDNNTNVLLSTAIVKVKAANGVEHLLRALIDPASQATIVTESTAQLLNFRREKANTGIIGMGECKSGTAKSQIKFTLQPRYPSDYTLAMVALILPKMTNKMPSEEATVNRKKFSNILLADPTFNTPGPINIVIGADYYGCLIEEGIIKNNGMVAQKTNIGWIITGPALNSKEIKPIKKMSFVTNIELNNLLETFFEQEEVNKQRALTEAEMACEEHFQKTHSRNKDGSYTVRIPFKTERKPLGESKTLAVARLLQIEKKFTREPRYKEEYHKFIKEYLELGHMKKCNKVSSEETYFIPHHAVLKESSTTTKLRVVFDASANTKNGENFNQQCYTGPRLQENLTRLLIRWRKHKYVFTADVEKMYRQIKVHQGDQRFQKIVWRFDPCQPVEEYQLTTVTYGTSSAPYLAVRTLQQLAKDENKTFPNAAKIMMNDFYVDDVLSGGESFNKTKARVTELLTAMNKGGFNLRKWVSNEPKLLVDIPEGNKVNSVVELKEENIISTLGLHWNPQRDDFQFIIKNPIRLDNLTKRQVLSELAKLFDPLGWISPILVNAKLIMQDMWAEQIDWDEKIPDEFQQRAESFFKDIKEIEMIKIPRWVQGNPTELHGFSDASNKAYAAVVFTRVPTKNGNFITTMVSSRTKTAPLRNKQTLARLELCGALLLAKLVTEVKLALRTTNIKTTLWTDSEVTLAWIKGDPRRWDTYVANRVAEIQQLTKNATWRHVSSGDNPADCASRGITTKELTQFKLWWHGPQFLAKSGWEKQNIQEFETNLHKRKIKTVCLTSITENERIYERWSKFNKTIRIMSYCYRFINRARKSTNQFDSTEIRAEEKNNTLTLIIQLLQGNEFPEELQDLKNGKSVKNKNNLLALTPFLDKNGIMRVGGRVKNSTLPYDQKHPILLKKGHFLKLIIRDAHLRTLHGGIELTKALIRQNYWIVKLTGQVTKELNNCIICKKYKAKISQQIMGNLPEVRIRPSRPFTHTGVDYAGPITLRMGVRGQKMTKGYIAIFVCMATKAMHIELVSDLTSRAFIAAFKRFIGRRGSPSKMYSDNGTNFVGANKLLKDEVKLIQNSKEEAEKVLAAEGTLWQFNPPGAPNIGGLWEAGVKSIKSHMKKAIGDSPLTFEEMTTVLTQIEGCLNSRPLYPITEDPDAKEILTPAHFLIGESLMAFPEQEIDQLTVTKRWTSLQQITQSFWKLWSSNYLHTLQQKYKWQKRKENIEIGDIVTIKDERLQPTKWPLGKVINVNPDPDGIVRIVDLKTGRHETITRHISKLCLIHKPEISKDEPITQGTIKQAPKRKLDEPKRDLKHVKVTTIQRVPSKTSIDVSNKPINIPSPLTRPTARNWMRASATEEVKKLVPTIKKPKKRGITISPCAWVKALLYTTTVLAVINGSHGDDPSYNLTYPNPGLYLEKMGIVQLDRGHIKVECPIDMIIMATDFKNVNKTVADFETTCDKTQEYTKDGHCKTWLTTLKEKMQQLANKVDIIRGQAATRSRRGLLGDFMQSIFGVNEEVYQSLDDIQETQNNIIKKTNHQSALLLSTVHQVNSTLSKFYESVTSKLNTGFALINEMQAWFVIADKERLETQLIHTAIEARNYIDEVNQKYDTLVKIIVHQGSIFDIIPYHKFELLKNKLNQQLPPNLQTMHKPEERLDIDFDDNKIVISGFIRLIESSRFELIAASFVPQRFGNDTFATSLAETRFLAINFNDQRYFQTSPTELGKCISVQKQTYLCAPSLIHNMELHSDCIIDFIINRHEEWTCSVRKFTVKEAIWKQLTMENTWMIISNDSVNAAINCNGIRTEIKIKNTAILKVKKGCIVTTKDKILLSQQQSSIDVHSTYQKPTQPINIANITMTKPHTAVKIAPIVGLEKSYIPEINEKELLALEPISTHHHPYSHHAISSACSIGIIILIYMAWSYRHTIKKTVCSHRSASKNVSITRPAAQQQKPPSETYAEVSLPTIAAPAATFASKQPQPTITAPAPTASARTWILA
jgi:hypothetical protein